MKESRVRIFIDPTETWRIRGRGSASDAMEDLEYRIKLIQTGSSPGLYQEFI